MAGVSRRGVLGAAGAAGVLATAVPVEAGASSAAAARPFPLDRVTLADGPFRDAMEVNRRRLLATDPDRLLHMFRLTAGLASTAEPLGGWEAPNNELRGHFTGHYLSACAMMAARGDEALKAKGRAVVEGLAACQKALGTGYVSAFPAEAFDRLNRRERVWAPFYTLHKILAGLLDMHALAGDPAALEVAKGLGGWIDRWSAAIAPEHMQAVLDTEFGGVGESLWNLQAQAGDRRWGRAALRFEKRKFLDPLAERRDALTGLHANTHIPQVIAAARRHELTGDAKSREIARFFWTDVTTHRCFVTGGTSSGEAWKEPVGALSKELDAYTHECCCSHNMLKLTDQVFAWNGDARAADYAERVLFNGVLGTNHPADGMMMYYVPMASGFWKMISEHDHGFWCCDGTGIESFAKLGSNFYFHDARTLWVNQYVPSELDWRERGVRVTQVTRYPEDGRIQVRLQMDRPQRFTVRMRVPGWMKDGEGFQLGLSGERTNPRVADGWLIIDRTWKDGDWIEIHLPMALRTEGFPDDRSQHALLWGPLVLAGKLGAEGLPAGAPYAEPTKPREVPEFKAEPVKAPALGEGELLAAVRSADQPMTWRAGSVSLVPFNRLWGERYAIYWKAVPA